MDAATGVRASGGERTPARHRLWSAHRAHVAAGGHLGWLAIVFALVAGLALFSFAVGDAHADAFVVTETNDSAIDCTATPTTCSLRGAILAANAAGPGPHTITFSGNGTYALTIGGTNEDNGLTGDLDLHSSITFTGNGTANTIIDAGSIDRVFDIHNLTGSSDRVVTFERLTIRGGNGQGPNATAAAGGGIAVRSAQQVVAGATTRVTLTEVVVRDNATINGSGGGISLVDSGASNPPVLTVADSTIASNTAGATVAQSGGGIHCSDCLATISRSTISSNRAESGAVNQGGGGIYVSGNASVVSITNSTITGNNAASGGGVYLAPSASTTTLTNVTVASNTATGIGGGIRRVDGPDGSNPTLNLTNTLLINNTASSGANMPVGTINGTDVTNLSTTGPLGGLANNGGPTQTHALLEGTGPGTAAINQGTAAPGAEPFDQRGSGFDRTSGAAIDIGAYEVQVIPTPEIAVSETTAGAIADEGSFSFGATPVGHPVTRTFTISNTGTGALTVSSVTVPAGFSVVSQPPGTIAAGTFGTFQVQLLADSIGAPSGSLSFTTNDADEGSYNFTISGAVTAPPTVELTQAAYSTPESVGTSMVVTLSRTGTVTAPTTVRVSRTGGTASPADYQADALPVDITFSAGEAAKPVAIPIAQDADDELGETIVLQVTTVTNATIGAGSAATLTIDDDDPAPSVTLGLTGSPLAEDGGLATVTATLSATSYQDVTVDLTFGGTAANVADYSRSGTQIVVAAGATSGTVTLTGVADLLHEGDETVVVDIASVTNGTESGAQQVTATIADQDPAPTVTLSLTGSPLAETGGAATVTATLSHVTYQTVTVDLGFSGTATNLADYTRSGTQIVVTAGTTTGTITLTGVHDAVPEADETIVVEISVVAGGTENGTQSVTATIDDDDPPPSVTLSLTGSPLAENGGAATVTATLSTVSGSDVTVNLGFGGSATAALDYNPSGTTILIPAGAPSGTIILTGLDDALDEADETIVVEIVAVTNGTESGTQQVTATIADDDPAPTVALGLTGSPLAERGGTATVTATLSAVSARDVTVTFTFAGTATLTADYAPSGLVVTIPAGSLSGAITLTAIDDNQVDPGETIVAEIDTVTNGTEAGAQQVTATIADDDAGGILVTPTSGLTTTEAGGTATFTIRLASVPSATVTVALASGNVAEGTVSPASVVFQPNASALTPQTVTVTGVNDAVQDGNVGYTIMTAPAVSADPTYGRVDPADVLATNLDDDVTAALSIGDVTAPEGHGGLAAATFTVSLNGPVQLPVSVRYATENDSALSTMDYQPASGTLTFAPGETSKTVVIQIVGDTVPEPDERFAVVLSSPTNATVARGRGTATILDDESTPTVSIDDIVVNESNEGARSATFTVRLSSPAGRPVSVQYATVDESATAPADYLAASGTLAFAPGETSKPISVQVVMDTTVEADETFAVRLSNPTNAALAVAEGRATIRASQDTIGSCSPRPDIGVEVRPAGPGTLRVLLRARQVPQLSSNRIQALRVVSATNAAVDLDPETITQFPGGQAGAPLDVQLTPIEPGETFAFTVRRLGPGAVTVNLIVNDNCGNWPTFVGAGAGMP